MLLHSHVLTLNSFWQRYYISSTLLHCGKCGGSQSYKRLVSINALWSGAVNTAEAKTANTSKPVYPLPLPQQGSHLAPNDCSRSLSRTWHVPWVWFCAQLSWLLTCVSLWKQHLHFVGQHIVGKPGRRLAECTIGTKYAFRLSSAHHKTAKQSKAVTADNRFKGKGTQKSSCHLVVSTMKKISSFKEINTDHLSITFLSGGKKVHLFLQ